MPHPQDNSLTRGEINLKYCHCVLKRNPHKILNAFEKQKS